jgi:polyisoprenyl-phosphate glycosyltransferase
VFLYEKMEKKRYDISIVVPAYNELKSLPLLIEKYKNEKKKINFQLIIVNNGSSDGTEEFLSQELKKRENSFVKAVNIEKNIGYGNGIHQGLKECDSEIMGWSHADLQCSPADIFKGYELYQKINNPKILVKGHRINRDKKSLILTYGLAVYSSFILLKFFNDINGQPKIFHRDLFQTFKIPPKGFSYDLYVQYKALKKGYKVYSFKVLFEKRIFGISKWAYSTISKFSTIKSFLIDVIKIRFGSIK